MSKVEVELGVYGTKYVLVVGIGQRWRIGKGLLKTKHTCVGLMLGKKTRSVDCSCLESRLKSRRVDRAF